MTLANAKRVVCLLEQPVHTMGMETHRRFMEMFGTFTAGVSDCICELRC